MKNVLIISTSFRKGGNSESLSEEFARGAQESGNKVEKIYLRDKNIGFCKGCLACVSTDFICLQNAKKYFCQCYGCVAA